MERKMQIDLSESEEQSVYDLFNEAKDIASELVTRCMAISPRLNKGSARNVVANALVSAAASQAVSAAVEDFKRNPRADWWLKSCGEAFERHASYNISTFEVCYDTDGATWKLVE